MTLAALTLTVLSWAAVPEEQSRPVPVELWVRRPVFMECGKREPCMEYQVVAYRSATVPESAGGVEWQHPFEPGDVLYARVGGCL